MEAALRDGPDAKLARHLETCVSCAAELDRARTSLSLLERQLEAELAVEVPPELSARVRQKLAEVPPGHGVSFVRVSVAAGLALAIVVGLAMVVSRSGVPVRTPEVTSAQVERPPAPVPRPAEREPSVSLPIPPRASSPAPPASTNEPRVLVPEGQEAAILLFHQRSKDGKLVLPLKRSPGPLAELRRLQITPLESTPLEVEPIEISPLSENVERLGHR